MIMDRRNWVHHRKRPGVWFKWFYILILLRFVKSSRSRCATSRYLVAGDSSSPLALSERKCNGADDKTKEGDFVKEGPAISRLSHYRGLLSLWCRSRLCVKAWSSRNIVSAHRPFGKREVKAAVDDLRARREYLQEGPRARRSWQS